MTGSRTLCQLHGDAAASSSVPEALDLHPGGGASRLEQLLVFLFCRDATHAGHCPPGKPPSRRFCQRADVPTLSLSSRPAGSRSPPGAPEPSALAARRPWLPLGVRLQAARRGALGGWSGGRARRQAGVGGGTLGAFTPAIPALCAHPKGRQLSSRHRSGEDGEGFAGPRSAGQPRRS